MLPTVTRCAKKERRNQVANSAKKVTGACASWEQGVREGLRRRGSQQQPRQQQQQRRQQGRQQRRHPPAPAQKKKISGARNREKKKTGHGDGSCCLPSLPPPCKGLSQEAPEVQLLPSQAHHEVETGL